MLHIQGKIIKGIRYFHERDPKFVLEIIKKWKTVCFRKKDFAYFTDSLPEHIYFITKGTAAYMDDNGNILTSFSNGAILGEVEIILGEK